MAALRAGTSGFLVKDTLPADVINAVLLVAAGDAIVSPSVTRTLLAHFGNTEASERHLDDKFQGMSVVVGGQ